MTSSQSPILDLPNTYRAFYGAFASLHAIQRQAIDPILRGKDVILQSATGSGKTEAVLAPCLERVIQAGQTSSVLYIVPTRALALDLERRLEPLVTERLELGFGVRTGDVKRSVGGRMALMLTTPESFDVMMGSANAEIRAFLLRIGAVVIDEVHPLVYQYRGRQLAYLLKRLERRSNRRLQKIALSATIADADAVVKFFGFQADAVRLTSTVQREIIPHFVHLKKEATELNALLDDLYDVWGYKKILLFANSRGRCDKLFAELGRRGRFRDVCDLHYSNLKPKERRSVEARFRRRSHALCIATSTLELGIDIGDVDGVILYEPPDSASALLQRIGRSNRRLGSTQFWGICRGERAGAQLLRFLALLHLAKLGAVESPLPKELPSVLAQQILSCLYEKKRISLLAMRELFPDRQKELDLLFPHMERQGWLRKENISLYHGGRLYRDCLINHKIWSNFPEEEEDYVLELSGEVIADLPSSIVRQLEVGDRLQLAGRRIHILQIDAGERKRVLAEPSEYLDDKEIFWLGAGFQVSFEAAQAIRSFSDLWEEDPDEAAPGLFARTQKLLAEELSERNKSVILANGIEVVRTSTGLYRYKTYLGSMGNLILQHTIAHQLSSRYEDLYTASDETGVDCSEFIDFQALRLPVDRNAHLDWTLTHMRIVRSILPLNAFCNALPRSLLAEELTDFIFDSRVAQFFIRYMTESSNAASGDPSMLDPFVPPSSRESSAIIDIPALGEPLLEWEKKRWEAVETDAALPPTSPSGLQRVTGTLMGEFMRHKQCERWLSLTLLPTDLQPRGKSGLDEEISDLRTSLGKQFERDVLERIASGGGHMEFIEAADSTGALRPFKDRFEESMAKLDELIKIAQSQGATINGGKASHDSPSSRYLSQAVLVGPLRMEPRSPQSPLRPFQPDGVGIPDLIRISPGAEGPILEVGDIKHSARPYYSQKWQVAFYAQLLKELARSGKTPAEAKISDFGFIIARPLRGASQPELHTFDLKPYLSAMRPVLRSMAKAAEIPPLAASCTLKEHCVTCPFFPFCYKRALYEEDILFLPQLSHGALAKMRRLGLKTMADAQEWLEELDPETAESSADNEENDCAEFEPHQRKRIKGHIEALLSNRILIHKRKTEAFPVNLSICIFLRFLKDPIAEAPLGIGFRAMDVSGKMIDANAWAVIAEEEMQSSWTAFSQLLTRLWKAGTEAAGGSPQLFHFGKSDRESFIEWDRQNSHATGQPPLFNNKKSHWTDLRRLILNHLDVPAPGALTLFALARILGLSSQPDEPESLFHPDAPQVAHSALEKEKQREELVSHLENDLKVQEAVWRFAAQHLESDYFREQTEQSEDSQESQASDYLRFLDEERRLREEDILSLQEYSLTERIERFRAIGPLSFMDASLDEEGRFLYRFRILREEKTGIAKFREGDFLKLAPIGVKDLQSGFPVILKDYDASVGEVSVLSRQSRLVVSARISYSLEEDISDWNAPKLEHAVRTVFGRDGYLLNSRSTIPLNRLFEGKWPTERSPSHLEWLRSWLSSNGAGFASISGLNPTQQQALELPFKYRLSLIEGPPGTGKTHLLAWILIALMMRALDEGNPLRIAVSALTHQAIDQVLAKVVDIVNRLRIKGFPARCAKLGRWREKEPPLSEDEFAVKPLDNPSELERFPYLILGATGFGLYQLFESRKGAFPSVFDWIIFDEASQVLVPQALLSLLYGKGNFLFLGDAKQLPPIVLGSYEEEEETAGEPAAADVSRSVLSQLAECYGPHLRMSLDRTYRMNEEICSFPSRMWYDGRLKPSPDAARSRLALPSAGAADQLDLIIDPDKPVALLLVEHEGCHQKSDLEVEAASRLAHRLIVDYHLAPERMALISPHRAQNNAIADRLRKLLSNPDIPLPLIDTVERVQGAERELILFSFSTSDPDHSMSEFLNNPNRFNVAITRARHKLIVIGSSAFFNAIPQDEKTLRANRCFKEFHSFCLEKNSVFVWNYR